MAKGQGGFTTLSTARKPEAGNGPAHGWGRTITALLPVLTMRLKPCDRAISKYKKPILADWLSAIEIAAKARKRVLLGDMAMSNGLSR